VIVFEPPVPANSGGRQFLGLETMEKKRRQKMISAFASVVLLLIDAFSNKKKNKEAAYEKAAKAIDEKADVAELQETIDDLLNKL